MANHLNEQDYLVFDLRQRPRATDGVTVRAASTRQALIRAGFITEAQYHSTRLTAPASADVLVTHDRHHDTLPGAFFYVLPA